uniref:SP13 phlebotomine family member n=1 Tax=Nyssomyia intermedia TaxID=182990 RepID=J7HIF4_9DIPT
MYKIIFISFVIAALVLCIGAAAMPDKFIVELLDTKFEPLDKLNNDGLPDKFDTLDDMKTSS